MFVGMVAKAVQSAWQPMSESSVCVCVSGIHSAPQLANPASIYLKTTLSLAGIPEGSKYMVSKAWT